MDKWATSQSIHVLTKVFIKLLLLLENALKQNCPKMQFWGPSNWKFEPSPRPHPHSDSITITHTEQVKTRI